MRFTAAIFIATAGIAAAQTSTSDAAGSSSTCLAENIVQACLASTGVRLSACDAQDYECQCSSYRDQLTCYNNCPDDVGRGTIESQVTAWCVAASAQSSQSAATETAKSSSSTSASASSSSDEASAATTTTDSTTSATDEATASAASPSAESTGLANPVAVPAGSMLAIALGLFGLM